MKTKILRNDMEVEEHVTGIDWRSDRRGCVQFPVR